ncbi:MAG: HEAT repeat domain-containing protein [Myxococcales bacterium]|nr:HEAT repeat domain-containing protein [Myxococcales bacterium]
MTRARDPLPISLDAALRDADVLDLKARTLALTHLGSAYLQALGAPDPVWQAHARDPRGPDVRAALLRALERDPATPIRALAAVGLGQLGAPDLLAALPDEWFHPEARADDLAYARECAAIAWTLLGLAARAELPAEPVPADSPAEPVPEDISPAPPEPVPEDSPRAALATARANLRRGLAGEFPELRFQCAVGLAELDGAAAEPVLARALAREREPGVVTALVTALGELAPPSPATCDALAPLCDGPDARTGFAAALALTVARDPRGGPALMRALRRPEDRGRALEALAALGPLAPPAALPVVRGLARGLLTPGLTRVRAAYALARLAPAEGHALLERLKNSWRPTVREAVADALTALAQLAARDGA